MVARRWLAGEVSATPPGTDAEWRRLLEHLAAIHAVRPGMASVLVPDANLTFTRAEECRRRVLNGAAQVPEAARTPEPARTLCRADPNTTNFLRRQRVWASVDWENSGSGDPVFELADLLAHPAYLGVPSARRAWAIERYGALSDDPHLGLRARAYLPLMMADWALFFARKAHEYEEGKKKPKARLVDRPPEWYATLAERAREYGEAAIELLRA